MKTSYAGRVAIAREEGVVLSAYKDSVGILTIGVGHTSAAGNPKVTSGLKIMLDEAFAIFERDLVKYERGVESAVKVPLKQHQFDALVSFHYNTGAIAKATLTKRLNAGDLDATADQFLVWNKAGGKVLPGLTARRKRERAMFLYGDYGDISGVNVWQVQGGKATRMPLPKPSAEPVPPPPDVPAPAPVESKTTNTGAAVGAGVVVVAATAATFWDRIWAFISNLF